MVVGVFMCVFLVGMLYYVVGIGDAILYAERAQDSADAGALSAAVMHARGMNFVVLLNLVMAALVTVLLALKLLLTLITIAIVVLTLISALGVSAAATAPLITGLNELRVVVDRTHESVKGVVFPMLRTLRSFAKVVRVVTPQVAQIDVVAEVVRHYSPPARFGFVLPQRTTLPLADDAFDALCREAGKNISNLALFPLDSIGLGAARDKVAEAAGSLSQSLASYFCSGGSGSPPSYTTKLERAYPMSPAMQRCMEESEHGGDAREACEQADQDRERAQPDGAGNCRPGADCTDTGPYGRMVRLAREQCNPARTLGLKAFVWQQALAREELTWDGHRWRRGEVRYDGHQIVSSYRVPCGTGGSVGTDFNEQVKEDGVRVPLCTEAVQLPLFAGREGEKRTLEYQAVTELLSCKQTIKKTFEMKGVEPVRGNTSDMAPQRVEPELMLGAEDFQLRVVSVRQEFASVAGRAMRIATWNQCRGADCGRSTLGSISTLTRFSVAQAEYYFEGKALPEEWMWTMSWRGRLVRFRLPDLSQKKQRGGGSDPDVARHGGIEPARSDQQACERQAQSADCRDTSGALGRLEALILH
jgi:hypothetical protein